MDCNKGIQERCNATLLVDSPIPKEKSTVVGTYISEAAPPLPPWLSAHKARVNLAHYKTCSNLPGMEFQLLEIWYL